MVSAEDASSGNADINAIRPLNILIAGAGIGGLTAAIGFRRQGHTVTIFEQSKLAQETGAAIHLAPNANGLLRRLGLKPEEIGAVDCLRISEYLPHNGELKYHIDTGKSASMWEHPWQFAHRAHLHTALKAMAIEFDGQGEPAILHTNSRVKQVDALNAKITLEDASEFTGDLIVGADGVNSKTRAAIPGGDLKPFESGKSAFRFLVPRELLATDPRTAKYVAQDGTLTMWNAEDRRLVMYSCVNNTFLNFVAIHPTAESSTDSTRDGWQSLGSKERLCQIYKDFEPNVRAIFEKVDESKLKVWQLLDMDQMPTFVTGRLAVIGDAAHPFLPHQGQGGAQAIEDAVSLAAVMPLGTDSEEIQDRLMLYNKCRYERSHKIQEFTRLAGRDKKKFAAEGKELDMMEFTAYNFGHDEWHASTYALRQHIERRDGAARIRCPQGFGASPGPRQPLNLSVTHPKIAAIRAATPETFRTYSIRFKSSRPFLETILPTGISFTSPATAVAASISCTTLDGMTWLGGGGYSFLALSIHGVHYTKRDGSKIRGTCMPLLFENLTDPILTGRAELGMPKLFADIDIQETSEDDSCVISIGWRGAVFGTFRWNELAKAEAAANGTNGAEQHSQLPPDDGLLVDRYVPAVGEPGKADASYTVLYPAPVPDVIEKKVTKNASFKFESLDWKRLPTLHHVSATLAEIPVYSIEQATLSRGTGVDDLASAKRIE